PILIGSSRYRLVTRDLSTQTFDFDFNLFIARIGEDLLENPDKIRQTFLDILDRNNEDFEFEKTKKNGSRTIKIKHQDGEYRVEFAILKYIDEQINILKLDTNTNKCIFI
ncbi:MAG: hypothetical protein K2I49_00465, partial [Ureaplasma sp.]|nr:hypothetical protein [Ureaplasma sp.]